MHNLYPCPAMYSFIVWKKNTEMAQDEGNRNPTKILENL